MSNQIETKYLGEIIKKHTQDITGKEVVITGTTSGTGYDVQMQSNVLPHFLLTKELFF